ncbi:restriction endonuclease subunit S [Bacillus mycoides]|uniref:restriction endonuclease subunit S n=1 Tax=Bacillus mycoides TaxID=1405 RepID=UPI003D231B02
MANTYASYKESKIEWIGKIPGNWSVTSVGKVYEITLGKMLQPTQIGIQDEIVPYLKAMNVQDGYLKTDKIDKMYASRSEMDHLRILPGDLLVCEGGEVARSVIVQKDLGGMIFQNSLHRVRGQKNYDVNFLHYYLIALRNSGFVDILVNKATIAHFTKDKFKSLKIALPNIMEQKEIVKFLNKRTKGIEVLIAYKEKLIEALGEKRQLMITEAVTKGLNPNVQMKDSGVKWIGEIPEHWTIKKIKHISNLVGSGKTPKGGSEIYPESGVLFLRSMNVHYDGIRLKDIVHITPEIDEDMRSTRVKSKDVLLNITGASIGRSCIVPESLGKANVNQHVCIIRSNTKVVVPELLSKIMSSNFIMQQILMSQNGSSREGLNFTQVKNLELPLTRDLHEQIEIANHISVETDKMISLISMIEQQIKKLKEYRQSLIYEAVTGKIDVRDFEVEA